MSKHEIAIALAKAAVSALGFGCLSLTGLSADPDIFSDTRNPGDVMQAHKAAMNPAAQLEFSKRDLASRLGLEPEMIEASAPRLVTWRSGALGCPKPGMSYTDALVPGILIELRVGDAVYRYHAAASGQPFHCPHEWAEPPVAGPGVD